ncbi:hypothetical protein AAP_01447 [Ascosphaera apis ARSEF 7405]|uniref:Uncharacterized protein n=1 Tax=Ascosphaera apis ARSEF 7405 TaxID=392613 RepID=A0A168BUQ9_9EURO|nr:hypothetical protein AAP_01447 [Ascosphaera apis ARSEF 7405]
MSPTDPPRPDDDALLAIIVICSVVFALAVIALTVLIWLNRRRKTAISRRGTGVTTEGSSWHESSFDNDALEKQQFHCETASKEVDNVSVEKREQDSGQPMLANEMPATLVTVPMKVLSRSNKSKTSDRSFYQSPIPSAKSLQNLSNVLSRPNPSFQSSAWDDCSVNMDVFAYSPNVMQWSHGTKIAQQQEFVDIPLEQVYKAELTHAYKQTIGLAKPLEVDIKPRKENRPQQQQQQQQRPSPLRNAHEAHRLSPCDR